MNGARDFVPDGTNCTSDSANESVPSLATWPLFPFFSLSVLCVLSAAKVVSLRMPKRILVRVVGRKLFLPVSRSPVAPSPSAPSAVCFSCGPAAPGTRPACLSVRVRGDGSPPRFRGGVGGEVCACVVRQFITAPVRASAQIRRLPKGSCRKRCLGKDVPWWLLPDLEFVGFLAEPH